MAGCRIVDFSPGCRPTDEAAHPGLGSSDQAAMLVDGALRNRAYVLYELPGWNGGPVQLDATLALTGPLGDREPAPLPGWHRRPLEPMAFSSPTELRPARAGDRVLALEIEPDRDLRVPGQDPYGFDNLFLQSLRVELRADGARAETRLNVCSVPKLGTLYAQVVERVLIPDTERQAAAARAPDLTYEYHPWFPVLCIGGEKAALYTRALIGDIVEKERHLSDPCWLLRVGINLELLTCLGIAEAVRDDVGDVLDPHEREAFDSAPEFEEIRRRIDPAAWRDVWELRHVTFPRIGTPLAGAVSARNLLCKKRATLGFLHAHHEDLKHAIELAGPNSHNSQETWHRVFRDAERAVLSKTAEAFPELGFLPRQARDFALWHRKGEIGTRRLRVPPAITGLLADQDGLFASACAQYRASMNHVADWAKSRGLMDHTGAECVPRSVSLFEAHESAPQRVDVLQRRDGYEGGLDVVPAEPAAAPPLADAEALIAEVPIFAVLSPEQVTALAGTSRPLGLGPAERFLVQNEPGRSLFVVADGQIEVVVRQEDGEDVVVDTMGRGEVLGEMALLTGEPRAATARAVEGALVYEVGRDHFDPLIAANPQWIDELAEIMARRLRERAAFLASRAQPAPRAGQLAKLIRRRVKESQVHAALGA